MDEIIRVELIERIKENRRQNLRSYLQYRRQGMTTRQETGNDRQAATTVGQF